jgi:hypothetical protein
MLGVVGMAIGMKSVDSGNSIDRTTLYGYY